MSGMSVAMAGSCKGSLGDRGARDHPMGEKCREWQQNAVSVLITLREGAGFIAWKVKL